VTWFGYVRDLDTRGTANTAISVGDENWAVGDKLYVHPTAPGKLTKVEPAAPNVKICVASVIIRNQTAGVLFVRPTTNLTAADLSDVQITSPASDQILLYDNNRWENVNFGIDIDTTPTLGGNLDGGGFNVSNVANISGGNLSVTGNVSGNVEGFEIGYRNVPQVTLSANVNVDLSDSGKHFYSTTAGDLAVLIPTNANVTFPVGTAFSVVVQAAGNVAVNADSGVTLYLAGNSTAGNRTVGTYGMATVLKVATDTWFINGTGVS